MLATSVKGLKTEHPMGGALTLAALSFAYGILHAVGPGHGKTIISSYVVANEETVRRGVIISFIAAGLQALTAVALVSLLLLGIKDDLGFVVAQAPEHFIENLKLDEKAKDGKKVVKEGR